MKCRTLWHFIWVFTVCQNTPVGVSSIQRVNMFLKPLAKSRVLNLFLFLNQNMLWVLKRTVCMRHFFEYPGVTRFSSHLSMYPQYTDRVIVKRYFKEMLIEAILLFNLNIWTPIILTYPAAQIRVCDEFFFSYF